MRNKANFSGLLLIAVILATATLALAQAPATQPVTDPLVSGQKALDARIQDYLIRAAEKMPEENYSFKPSPDVRSFGQMLAHVADTQYFFGSTLLGVKNPEPGIEKNKTTKAELIQALKEAFAYSNKAYEGLTDAKAAAPITLFGRPGTKLTVLSINYAHNSEHYGNIVTYMRIKGLVPPSSEPRK